MHDMVVNSIVNNLGAYIEYRIKNFWKEGVASVGCWEEHRDFLTRLGFFTSLNFFQYITFLLIYVVLFFAISEKVKCAFFDIFTVSCWRRSLCCNGWCAKFLGASDCDLHTCFVFTFWTGIGFIIYKIKCKEC